MELRRSDARLGSSRVGKSFIAWLLVLTLIFPVGAGKVAQAADSSSWTKMGGTSLSTPSYVNTLLQVDGTLYAGASDGLWTYSDSDDAWTKMNGLTGDVNTLLQVDDTLYALVPDGVWTYSGGEWVQMSDSPSAVYDMLHVNGTLYVGTADGIWTYRDGAWTQTSGMPSDVGVSNMMLYNFAGTLYALVQESGDTDWSSSIWAYSAISDVDGTWIKMEGEDAPSHANALLHIDGSLYARAADGIWTYRDGEWTHMDGSPSGLGPFLSVDNTLNAGASDGVWTYRNGEWMLMEGSPSEAYALLNEDSTLYAVTEDGVYRYKNGSGNTAPDVVTAISGESIEVTTEPVSITVPQGVTDVTVQLTTTTNGPNEQVATVPLIEVNAATALGNVSVSIPAGTTITGPAGWDGTMGLPQVLSNSSIAVSNGTVNAVIEVGAGNSPLTFNKAVRLVLPGQAGKSAGFARNGVVTDITRTLGADDQATADAQIPAEGEAKIAVGSDLVIWTKHFTAFLSYTVNTTDDPMEWQVVGDGIFPSKSSKPVVAFDSSGAPYVVYEDADNGDKLTVKKYDGSHWDTVGNAGFSTLVSGDLVSLVFDGNDIPYVLYRDKERNTGATVMKYDQDEQGQYQWMTVGSPNISYNTTYDYLKYLSIAIDRNGTPYVAYSSMNNDDNFWNVISPPSESGYRVIVKKYVDNKWVRVGSKVVGGRDAAFLYLTFDRSGSTDIPYVLYQDTKDSNARGTMKKYDESSNSWVAVGNSTSTGYLWFASIAINSSGIPYVAFGDGGDGEKGFVKTLVGSSWETVGGAEVSEGATDYPMIVLDSGDTHYVVYQDMGTYDSATGQYSGATYKSTVKKFVGSSWETVGGEEISSSEAYAASIALDGNDTPYVAYWDTSESVVVKKLAPIPKYTVSASAATDTPEVGADDAITLTVKDALGNTDTSFGGAHDVTVSGYLQASDNSYGSFNGTELTGANTTVSVTFTNGVATANLKLNKAATQMILFSVADVATPATNTVSLTPLAGVAASMALTTDIAAPASNGGVFAQQPGVTLLDAYGNTSTGDNSTVVTVSRKDTGEWMLTGTLTATASGGVATFTDLGATNEAEVAGAQLAFDATGGLTQIVSQSVTLPWSGTVPSAPTGVTAKAGNGQAVVSFTAPVNGGSGITSYEVKAVQANITATGTGSPITITGLTNGVTYTFTVKAINSAGSSTASDASNPVTPSAPSNSGGTWTPPAAPTTTLDPEPSTDAEPTTDPEQPAVAVFNSGIINEANLLKMFESKVAEAKKANVKIEYADIQGHWAEKAIDIFAKLHLISGYENGTFKPDGHITRAEFAVILSHVFDITGGDNAKAELKDVGSHWAKEAIAKLIKAGVINGYKDGTFRPGNTITREEMVVMLSRIVNLDNVTKDTSKGRFNDLNGTYAAEEIKAVAQAGIISGKGGGKFDPHNKATRAEALQIILNVLKLNPQLKARLDSLNE